MILIKLLKRSATLFLLSGLLIISCKDNGTNTDNQGQVQDSFYVHIQVSPSEGGTVTPFVGKKTFKAGKTIELKAEPSDGYKFTAWISNDGRTTNNPLSLTVDKNFSFTVHFKNTLPPFYLDENGVTVICPQAAIGDTGTVKGVKYTKRQVSEITESNASTTCTSGIKDMSGLFYSSGNPNISTWDVSDVTDMNSMFKFNHDFNQDISEWDVSNVTDMGKMFWGAEKFNQGIGVWDVSSVTNMKQMFWAASAFNQDLSDWCVKNIDNEPDHFAEQTKLESDDLPVWGTCPDENN
jgi:surface protein